jgi:predicted oxidoreductase
VELMGCSHGSVNHILPAEDVPNLSGAVMTIGRSAITSRSAVEKSCTMADSIEELAAKLYEDETAQKNMIAAVQRYNELCQKGIDEDFNKVSKRMFPLEKAPFYATKISAGSMLVCLGGLSVDPVTMKVVDEDMNPIDGLYAVGNNMGGRILQDYPVTIAGASHGTCLTFGYLVGRKVAES